MSDLRPTIKLMADYDSWPLWNVTEIVNLDPETLPLSAATHLALANWERCFNSTLNRADPLKSGFETPEAAESFNAEGRPLWGLLRQELPGNEVVYFGQDARKVPDERDR